MVRGCSWGSNCKTYLEVGSVSASEWVESMACMIDESESLLDALLVKWISCTPSIKELARRG